MKKQEIILIAQQLLDAAGRREGVHAPGDKEFVITGLVEALGNLLTDYPRRWSGLVQDPEDPENCYLPCSYEDDVCVSMLEGLVKDIRIRWREEREAFFSALTRYGEGLTVDEDGNPVGDEGRPYPEEPFPGLTVEEIGRLTDLLAGFRWSSDQALGLYVHRGAGSEAAKRAVPLVGKPRWDSKSGTLYFNNIKCHTFSRNATKQMKLLAAFEELGWPEDAINNPMEDEVELRQTVKDFNRLGLPFGFRRENLRVRWVRRSAGGDLP
jgi:hypothetical protein